ncbi:MAG: CAP domain-containing protein [Gaiellaceae bacterium]
MASQPASLVPIPPPVTSGAALVTKAAAGVSGSATSRLSSAEQALAAGIDTVRRQRGEAKLSVSSGLVRAAQEHAASMARLGYFSHSSPGGTPFWRRIARYYPVSGARTWKVGENLFWSVAPASSDAATSAWLASPEHKRILLGRWTEVGVAVARVARAPGVFGDQDVVIVVADFGSRSR